ncbi:MAG: tetratricopeptide repeat protein [Pirellulaceae bacterium]
MVANVWRLRLQRLCRGGASLCLLVLMGGYVGAWQTADEDRFLEGLRQRRLFQLAEFYCRERLADESLSEFDRAQLTVELIRGLAEHAVNAPRNVRDPLWQRARETATRFVSEHSTHPHLILVKMQDALTVLARGELTRMESELGVARAKTAEDARGTIREATRLLARIEEELNELIAQRRRPPRLGELAAAELTALQQNVRFQRARALRNLGLSYPPKSADRVASVTQALEHLRQALLQVAADEPLAQRMRMDQIVCCRLLGDLTQSQQFLEAFPKQEISREIQAQWRAETIRLVLARDGPRAAQALVSKWDVTKWNITQGHGSPEWEFAQLETQIALWQASAEKDEDEAARWRDLAVATVKRVERTYGRYWARRAELYLVNTGRGRGSGSLDILERTANDFYAKGRLDEALATYDEAASVASDAENDHQAFAFAYKAALLQQQRTRHADAAQRFQQLALSMPNYPDASNAHLHAVVNVAQQAAQDSTVAARRYVPLLEEHLQHWPGEATADTARLWLGKFHESQRAWEPAVAAFRAVAPTASFHAEAVDALAHCWRSWLAQLRAAKSDTGLTAIDAAEYFEDVAYGPDGATPENWSDLARRAALTAARIRRDYTTADLSELEEVLLKALQGTPPPTPEWKTEAQLLLVAVLAAQPGRGSDAQRVVAGIDQANRELLVALMLRLAELPGNRLPDQRSELGAIQLAVARLLGPQLERLGTQQKQTVEHLQAVALAATGKHEQALAALAELAQRYPDDVSIQQSFGEWLSRADDRESLEKAVAQWRQIAARCRPRTTHWFDAKYQLAQVQFKLGHKAAASKLIRYLQATEDLSQSERYPDFLRLLEQCER